MSQTIATQLGIVEDLPQKKDPGTQPTTQSDIKDQYKIKQPGARDLYRF